MTGLRGVHATVETAAGVGNVWSLETLRRWLAEKAGSSDVATLKQYVSVIPEHLVRRFISAEQDAVVVQTGRPDIFYARLTDLAASGELGVIHEVTSPDDNLQAVFQYLVKS